MRAAFGNHPGDGQSSNGHLLDAKCCFGHLPEIWAPCILRANMAPERLQQLVPYACPVRGQNTWHKGGVCGDPGAAARGWWGCFRGHSRRWPKQRWFVGSRSWLILARGWPLWAPSWLRLSPSWPSAFFLGSLMVPTPRPPPALALAFVLPLSQVSCYVIGQALPHLEGAS